jgi:hypothetical protein
MNDVSCDRVWNPGTLSDVALRCSENPAGCIIGLATATSLMPARVSRATACSRTYAAGRLSGALAG